MLNSAGVYELTQGRYYKDELCFLLSEWFLIIGGCRFRVKFIDCRWWLMWLWIADHCWWLLLNCEGFLIHLPNFTVSLNSKTAFSDVFWFLKVPYCWWPRKASVESSGNHIVFFAQEKNDKVVEDHMQMSIPQRGQFTQVRPWHMWRVHLTFT